MHSIFYRDLRWGFSMGVCAQGLLGISGGTVFGLLAFSLLPKALYPDLAAGILSTPPSVGRMLLCGWLPLLLCIVLRLCGIRRNGVLIVSVPLSFLLTFSACLMCSLKDGWLAALLLLSGRCVSLAYVFWFLDRRKRSGNVSVVVDLCISAALTALTLLVFHWLTAPGIAVFVTI